MAKLRLDEVGYWSEIKLEILEQYARAYSVILSSQANIAAHLYIDGFAGAGEHIAKRTQTKIPGSPSIALGIEPKYRDRGV